MVVVNESIIAIIGLGVLAGGGIIIVDALLVRKIRRLAASGEPSERVSGDLSERSDDRAV